MKHINAAIRARIPHPMRCAICGEHLTDEHGVAIRDIRARDRWTCESHELEKLEASPPRGRGPVMMLDDLIAEVTVKHDAAERSFEREDAYDAGASGARFYLGQRDAFAHVLVLLLKLKAEGDHP